jgi:hypothetical protein
VSIANVKRSGRNQNPAILEQIELWFICNTPGYTD